MGHEYLASFGNKYPSQSFQDSNSILSLWIMAWTFSGRHFCAGSSIREYSGILQNIGVLG